MASNGREPTNRELKASVIKKVKPTDNMLSEWKRYKTKELIKAGVLTIGDGYRATNSELGESGIPFARAGNINDGFNFGAADLLKPASVAKAGEKISQDGDVVFTSKGTVGRFAFVRSRTPQFAYSPQLCYWRSRDHEKLDPHFLFYWMQGPASWSQINWAKGQTDMADYVSLRDQRESFWLDLPSPYEQRRIAHILGALDDKIELNRQLNATLEQLARGFFQSWFVDFDPLRAKASGEPDESICRRLGLTPELLALFPAALEDSAMGKIPAGWEMETAESFLNILSGFAFKSDSFHDEGKYGLVTIRNVQDGHFVSDTKELLAELPHNMPSYCHLSSGDVLLSLTGNVGRICFVVGENFLLNQRVAKIEAKHKDERAFAYFFMRREEVKNHLISIAKGTAQLNLSPIETKRMKVILPPKYLRQAYSRIAETFFQQLVSNEEESRTLAALRDELLPKLLSGEIRLN